MEIFVIMVYTKSMKAKFTPEDLRQIDQESLERLRKHEVISLTLRLVAFAIDLYEKSQLNSSNSSKPPSSDNPYQKGKPAADDSSKEPDHAQNDSHNPELSQDQDQNSPDVSQDSNAGDNTESNPVLPDKSDNRKPGRQPGSQGFGRKGKPKVDYVEHHYPERCVICGRKLKHDLFAHTGFYTFELEKQPLQIKISCTHHLYYSQVCACGHENIEQPASGYVSVIDGRKRDLKLSEYTIVGPMLTTFIASLNRDLGLSRNKIQRFLQSWYGFDLSIGTICKCIREAGIACYPVVEQLIEQLQDAQLVHMDETPWYQKGIFCWVWVAISHNIAIYQIGTRKKEQLLKLITEAFFGWLVTDGYGVYRSHEKRQRCLAHLIRKAVRLSGAVDQKAQKMGEWLLRELRGLIKEMAQGQDGKKPCRPILARLKRACNLGSTSDHAGLKSLAKEILNDWDAVVAFVKNPGLPATNNSAERALRWVVLHRKITFGTRTDEGSQSFAAMISVIATCRLRNVDPWAYIAQTVARSRKGLAHLPID